MQNYDTLSVRICVTIYRVHTLPPARKTQKEISPCPQSFPERYLLLFSSRLIALFYIYIYFTFIFITSILTHISLNTIERISFKQIRAVSYYLGLCAGPGSMI